MSNDSVESKVAKKKTEKKAVNPSHWDAVMNAIIQVESGGNSKAVNGRYAGAMQISPVLVKECNNILKNRNVAKRFTLSDRFSVKKSKEMFLLIQSHYNPSNNIEKGIRIWNGGCNYKVASTNRYVRRVMNMM
ncbi:MAG: transglycosylase SLT domain-containing protein [Bacteroidaceae bacterium]|nr:transglycosylase SLT domain-containing protein [Bacteroidaceae bacterium]